MIGEKTMKDLKKRIVAQIDSETMKEIVEQDLDLFFKEVRKLKTLHNAKKLKEKLK